VARIYRLTFKCVTSNGILVEPSLHYQTDLSLGGSEPDPSDVAAGVWGHIGTQFLSCFSAITTCQELLALEEVVPPAIGVAGVHSVGLPGTLAGSGDSIPPGLVPLINLHTDTRSRSARGWMHPPSPQWADRAGYSTWDGTMLSVLGDFASLLDDVITIGSVITTDLRPGVYSRTRALRGETPDFFHLVSASVNHTPKWLRSRMTTP